MVAHHYTDSTKTTDFSRPTRDFPIPSIGMNLPQILLRPIDQWSKQDVQRWIEYCTDEYSLSDVNRNDFEMNGKALLLFNENSFRQRAPRSGDVLYKALQQHSAMMKSLNCQAFPAHLWGHFGLPVPPSARHFNFPLIPSSPLSMPTYHSNQAAAPPPPHPHPPYLHSAFSYMFNHPSAVHPRMAHLTTPPSRRTREMSTSSTGSSCASSIKAPCSSLEKNRLFLPMPESIEMTRERSPSPMDRPLTLNELSVSRSPSIKREYSHDDDDDQLETSPSSKSPLVPSQADLFVRATQQPNDVTNTSRPNDGNDQTRQIRYFHDRIDFRGDIIMKPPSAKNCRILWEFLFLLLEDPNYESIIQWENRERMVFRIIQADKLAALWGLQKNRLSMTYEKLSRGMRYYYANNIISKEQSKRLLYRFMRSPEEIRKSMKRHTGPSATLFSILNKKPSSVITPHPQETHGDLDDRACPVSADVKTSRSFLPLASDYPQSYLSLGSNFSLEDARLLSTRQIKREFPLSYVSRPSMPSLRSTSKSDRSSSSSPDSFDSGHDRLSDCEKQSFSSSASSSSTSTKRKQAIPLSSSSRLSHGFLIDQPLNLVVVKEEGHDEDQEQNTFDVKKHKRIVSS